jgi:hypothetical protein
MATIQLPKDFKEFLRLLNSERVEYLVVGGYAVGYHGYPRPTGDLDIWIGSTPGNATAAMEVLRKFGFGSHDLFADLFLEKNRIIRMGLPPIRIEVLTSVSGLAFPECYRRRVTATLDGEDLSIIGLEDLKANKRAAGRHKDLNDLEELP